MPLPVFFPRSRSRRRAGVSELYASMLMLGVTLSFGGLVAGLALSQFGTASAAASVGAGQQADMIGTQVSYLVSAVSVPGVCPTYQGAAEGTALTVYIFDYGTQPFAPSLGAVNGTLYTLNQGPIAAGLSGGVTFSLLPSGTCAHQGGQTIILTDSQGDETQFVT